MSEVKLIKFEIVTPEHVVLKEQVSRVTVPAVDGEITVLAGHVPLISVLKAGVIEITLANGQLDVLAVSGGFIEVLVDKVVILADTAEIARELNEERIQIARAKAEELKKGVKFGQADFAEAPAALEKELARSRAVRRWKRLRK